MSCGVGLLCVHAVRPVRSTRTGLGSSWPRAPASSCSRPRSTRWYGPWPLANKQQQLLASSHACLHGVGPQARGATIYCELAGYGASCDAHHITAPHPEGEGLANCMNMALGVAGVKPEEVGRAVGLHACTRPLPACLAGADDKGGWCGCHQCHHQVDYINAHGTSTPYNDKFETMAIKRVFGEHAKNLKVSSIKSMTGHSLGAAGALEAIACAKAIKEGVIPPTINYETPDPDCDLDYVPNKAIKHDINVAVSDNLGG